MELPTLLLANSQLYIDFLFNVQPLLRIQRLPLFWKVKVLLNVQLKTFNGNRVSLTECCKPAVHYIRVYSMFVCEVSIYIGTTITRGRHIYLQNNLFNVFRWRFMRIDAKYSTAAKRD